MSFNTDSLESMCELIVDCPHSTPEWTDSGVIVLRNQNIKNGNLDLSSPSYTTQKDFEGRIKRAAPTEGDIVLTREAPMGEVCRIPKGIKCCLGQRQVLLRPKKEVDGDYLFWALQSPFVQNQIAWSEGTGSTVSNLRIPLIKALKIPRFHGSEKNIGKTLNGLWKKIHLNTQTNQTLESIAQAIFKSWFVDFEPVKAKMAALAEGGTREQAELAAMGAISGKSEPELAQLQQQNPEHYQQLTETAALFPSAMVESELGEIPEGWEVKSISDISTFPNGKIDTNALNFSNYISTENMLENRGGISEAASLPSTSTVPQFSPNQILISNIRPYFKKIWLARFSGGRSNDVLAFAAKESGNAEFLYNLLYQDSFFEFMTRTSKGAKMPRGDKNAISNWKFACAPILLRSHFSKEVRCMYSKIQNANNQNIELAELRDSLLPKLLSGEIDLSESALTLALSQGERELESANG